MTVFEAWMLDESKIALFRESIFELDCQSIPLFFETCWRIKLALENTFYICQNNQSINVSL